MSEIRIFIADAAFLVREGLKKVISSYPYMEVIGEACNSRELHQKLPQANPDILIIDYNAPKAFEPDDLKYAMEICPQANMLAISSNLHRPDVLKVLEYGTKGFLLKECDQTEIIGAIHAVNKREKFFCGKVLDIILERADHENNGENCIPTKLTERENQIVTLMAEGHSTQQIATILSLSVHTIYTHRKNIMKKLGVTTAAEVILYAFHSSLVPSPKQ